MAATISVKEVNGDGPTASTITGAVLCTKDIYNPGTTYPLVKPTSGTNRSYWKHFYLNADTSPTGTINNVKWYTDGTIGWTGVTLYAGTHTTYVKAAGTEGTTGNDYTTVALSDAAAMTSASPLSVTGTISNPNTGKISNYVIVQADLSTSATAGTLSAETITWRYDET
jgi:hypothetical protein